MQFYLKTHKQFCFIFFLKLVCCPKHIAANRRYSQVHNELVIVIKHVLLVNIPGLLLCIHEVAAEAKGFILNKCCKSSNSWFFSVLAQ